MKRWEVPVIATAVLVLVGIGVLCVFSASAVRAGEMKGNWEYFFLRQLAFAALGFLALGVTAAVPYTFWEGKAALGWLATLLLLLAVLLIGETRNGATRWLDLGVASLQASELAKLAVVLYLARYLSRREEIAERAGLMVPALLMVGALALLILLEPDLGGAVFLFLLTLGLFFLAGVRWKALLLLAGVGMLAGALLVVTSGYRLDRVKGFLFDSGGGAAGAAAEGAAAEGATQVDQSLMALANGGLLGTGLGLGSSKLLFLPEAHTDFILAVWGEERGLAGVLLVLVCFALLAWGGMRIARRAPDPFSSYLAAGVTLMLVLQALLNALVVTGLVPPKGIALPFVSYGGSSLVVSLAAVGLLLNIGARCAPAGRAA